MLNYKPAVGCFFVEPFNKKNIKQYSFLFSRLNLPLLSADEIDKAFIYFIGRKVSDFSSYSAILYLLPLVIYQAFHRCLFLSSALKADRQVAIKIWSYACLLSVSDLYRHLCTVCIAVVYLMHASLNASLIKPSEMVVAPQHSFTVNRPQVDSD